MARQLNRQIVARARGILILLLVLFVASCGDSGLDVTNTDPSGPEGNVVATSDCKSFDKGGLVDITPVTQDCVVYELDNSGTLLLTHVNAGFNCCPGDLTADIMIEDGLITIVENEAQSACRCLCLYDVEYEITNLPLEEYTIRFVEIYTTEEDEILEFTVDLQTTHSGIKCVTRDHYPWHESAIREDPFGFLVDASGCKLFSDNGAIDDTPPTQDCVDYHYNGEEVLLITHLNAGFNCCPVIDPKITIENNIIRIEETEVEGLCDCLCLFDLEFEVRNLPAGTYTIVVIEPYVREGDEKLEFSVNLTTAPTGSHCVERTHYPWGTVGDLTKHH